MGNSFFVSCREGKVTVERQGVIQVPKPAAVGYIFKSTESAEMFISTFSRQVWDIIIDNPSLCLGLDGWM